MYLVFWIFLFFFNSIVFLYTCPIFIPLHSLYGVWEGNGYNHVWFSLLQLEVFQHTPFSTAPRDWSSPFSIYSTYSSLRLPAYADSSLLACVPWCCSCCSWRRGPAPHRETTQTQVWVFFSPSLDKSWPNGFFSQTELSADHGTVIYLPHGIGKIN